MAYRLILLYVFAIGVVPLAFGDVLELQPFSTLYADDGTLRIGTLALAVTRIVALSGNDGQGATGFFFLYDKEVYLITNRHVIKKEANNGEPAFEAEYIIIILHNNPTDISSVSPYTQNLYSPDSGEQLWLEHPTLKNELDLIAIPVFEEDNTGDFLVSAFTADNFITKEDVVYIGEDVIIIGYPLGIYDQYYNLPLFREGMIASFYPIPFNREPIFYVDARLHKGMSGGPVILKPGMARSTIKGGIDTSTIGKIYLLGVQSSKIYPVNFDPEEYEPLGLNEVIYWELIQEIVSGRE